MRVVIVCSLYKLQLLLLLLCIIAYIVSIAINTIFEQIFILFVIEQPTLFLVNLGWIKHLHLRIPFLFIRG